MHRTRISAARKPKRWRSAARARRRENRPSFMFSRSASFGNRDGFSGKDLSVYADSRLRTPISQALSIQRRGDSGHVARHAASFGESLAASKNDSKGASVAHQCTSYSRAKSSHAQKGTFSYGRRLRQVCRAMLEHAGDICNPQRADTSSRVAPGLCSYRECGTSFGYESLQKRDPYLNQFD